MAKKKQKKLMQEFKNNGEPSKDLQLVFDKSNKRC